MSYADILSKLKSLGVCKLFKPCVEPETGVVLLRTRKPAQILAGYLVGPEIALIGNEFKVWTPQKKKAKALAKRYGLKIRLFDTEAELIVPGSLADLLLPLFGAKQKRVLSPEQSEAAKARLQVVRNLQNLRK